eukprot:7217079-Prymnesium_polylepis.1
MSHLHEGTNRDSRTEGEGGVLRGRKQGERSDGAEEKLVMLFAWRVPAPKLLSLHVANTRV